MKPFPQSPIVILLFLAFCCCDKDEPVAPPVQPITPEDTCYNDAPLTPYDSVHQQWPNMKGGYFVYRINVSPATGDWVGYSDVQGWNGVTNSGVFLYDPTNEDAITFLSAWDAEWSKNGTHLLLDNGFDGFKIYDVGQNRLLNPIIIQGATGPHWSKDERWIYVNKYGPSGIGGIWRVRPDGSDLELRANMAFNAREIDSIHFVGFDENGMYIYHTETAEFERIDFPNLPTDEYAFRSSSSLSWSISPDRKKILVDLFSKQGFIKGRDIGGLFLIDLESRTARKIRSQQYWGDPFYPTWVTNERFYGSYFCRTKSFITTCSMVWEFDLEGNFIKQITYPWMVLYPL